MKICTKCGVSQNDDRTTCIECGAVLPKALSEDEAWKIEKSRREEISQFTESKEYDYIGVEQIIIIVLSIVLLIASIVLLQLSRYAVFIPRRPEMMVLVIFFCAVNAFVTAFPRAEWFLCSLRFRFYISESEPEPSSLYKSANRFFKWLILVLSVLAFIYTF